MTKQEYQKQYRIKNADKLRKSRKKYRQPYKPIKRVAEQRDIKGWVCDCEHLPTKGAGKFLPTSVTSDNICTLCGHYAVLAPLGLLHLAPGLWNHKYKHGSEDSDYSLWAF